MRKVMKIVLILLGVVLILLTVGFFYIKSKLPKQFAIHSYQCVDYSAYS